MAETDITAAWHLLEIMAIAQAVLMALFGVYFALFVLAMWANHGRSDISSRRLKSVTIVLFVNMVIFVLVRSLQFSRARVLHPPEREFFNWGIPLTVIGNIQTTTIGMLADGLLAWRFYVLYDQQRWALWVPMFFVIINALLCYSADAQHFAAYFNYDYYQNTLLEVTLSVTIAWGWVMMATNTVLTAGIITKIIMVARDSGTLRTYDTAIRACIESSLVTWVGLVTYEISSLAPQGKVTSHLDVGFVLLLVLPVFFGISQCLIVARIALSNEFGSKTRQSTRDGTFSGAGTSSAGYSFATAPTPSANFKSVSFNQQQSTTFGTAHSTRTSDDDVTGIKPAEDERDVYELEMGRSRIGRAL